MLDTQNQNFYIPWEPERHCNIVTIIQTLCLPLLELITLGSHVLSLTNYKYLMLIIQMLCPTLACSPCENSL